MPEFIVNEQIEKERVLESKTRNRLEPCQRLRLTLPRPSQVPVIRDGEGGHTDSSGQAELIGYIT